MSMPAPDTLPRLADTAELDSAPARAALPLSAGLPPTLAYSSGDAFPLLLARPALVAMAWLAVLSGLCVATCFGLLYDQGGTVSSTAHVLVYAVTLGTATLAGVRGAKARLTPLRSNALTTLDVVAGVGLAMIAVAPLFSPRVWNYDRQAGVYIGTAFLLLAVSTPRHVLFYRGLAGLVRPTGRRGLARWLVVLGWIKLVYEGLWLLCCSAPLGIALPQDVQHELEGPGVVAIFGAFFGCIGFAGVWVAMMVTHFRLVAVSRRGPVTGSRRGFEVGPRSAPGALVANDV